MAANQKNSNLFGYTDDFARAWAVRGPIDTAINALDGSAAFTPGSPVWINSRRRRVREAVFYDPTTFRTVRFPVYTPTAFSAITGASTLAVNVPGESASVTYSLSQKVPERQPVAKTSRNLADHS